MLKKCLLIVLPLLVVIGATAWFKRIDLMLAVVKYRSEREVVIAPNRQIFWQQGPQQSAVAAAERPIR